MAGFLAWLSGKKTNLQAIAVALLTFAHSKFWIDTELFNMLVGLLGAGIVMSMRAGINKVKNGG